MERGRRNDRRGQPRICAMSTTKARRQGMKKGLICRITGAVLFCFLAATLPAVAQDAHQDNQHEKHAQTHGKTEKAPHAAPKKQAKPAGHAARPEAARTTAARPTHGEHGQTTHATHAETSHARTTHATHVQTSHPSHIQASHVSHNRQTSHRSNAGRAGARPSANRARGHRPAQWGRPPAHRSSYHFRSDDRAHLLRYYGSRGRVIQGGSRPVVVVGGYFPYAYIDYLSPLPADLYGSYTTT